MFPRSLWFYHQAQRSQWLPRSEIKKIQEKRLRSMTSHAFHRTRFYRQRFREAEINPDDIRTLDDLHKIRPITKSDIIKAYPDRIIAENFDPRKCFKTHTTGSKGKPMPVLYDWRYLDYIRALTQRVRLAIGVKPDHRKAWIDFGDANDPGHPPSLKGRLWQKIPGRHSRIFFMKYSGDEVVSGLEDFQPDVLGGRPMYLRLVVDEVTKSGHPEIKPKILMTRGDVLDSSTRRLLETRLQCDVYDTYGANDAGPIAWQCSKKSGYHMDAEYTICEFLKDDQPVGEGEPGEITVTNLVNYAEPMIRYRLGDIGTYSLEDCPCKRTLPILKSIEGRSSEFIHLPDGGSISPKSLLETMLSGEGSPRFQVVKGGVDGIITLRIFGQHVLEGVSDRMIKTSHDLFGEAIKVERSPDLPKAKIRPVVTLENGDLP